MSARPPLKLAIVQGAFFPVPALLGGAIEKIWDDLGRTFAARGHEVTHLSCTHPELPRSEKSAGVQHVRVRGGRACRNPVLYKWRDLRYTIRARRWLNQVPRADLVVTHTFWAPMLLNPNRHGLIYVHAARFPKGQMRWYRKAARLQTVSSAVAKAICKEAPALIDRVSVVPNHLERVHPAKPLWPTDKSPTFVYAGRIHPEKGLVLLVEAMAQLPDSLRRLHLVGPWQATQGGGGDLFKEQLTKQALSTGITLTWTGGIYDREAYGNALRDGDIFVYPSRAAQGESFGVAPLEAMSHGLPTIVSDLACFRDFLRREETGLIFPAFAPDAATLLAQQMQRLASDRAFAQGLAVAGRQEAHKFLLSTVASRYEDDFYTTLESCQK